MARTTGQNGRGSPLKLSLPVTAIELAPLPDLALDNLSGPDGPRHCAAPRAVVAHPHMEELEVASSDTSSGTFSAYLKL